MNQREKNLKLSCIACLFAGLLAIIAGALAAMAAFDADAIATLVGGLIGLPLGIHVSRLANVPSNAKTVRNFSLIMLLASSSLGIAAMTLGDPTVFQEVALVCSSVIGLLMTIFSSILVKEQERV